MELSFTYWQCTDFFETDFAGTGNRTPGQQDVCNNLDIERPMELSLSYLTGNLNGIVNNAPDAKVTEGNSKEKF